MWKEALHTQKKRVPFASGKYNTVYYKYLGIVTNLSSTEFLNKNSSCPKQARVSGNLNKQMKTKVSAINSFEPTT